jgi:hypothetical protein
MTMISHPNAAELARAVAHWLDEVRPQLDARNAYLARVAINALNVIDRELTQSDMAESSITPRLSKLLGHEGEVFGGYAALTQELCEALRNGRLNVATPDLLAVLRDDTLAKLSIDQPNYRHETSQS